MPPLAPRIELIWMARAAHLPQVHLRSLTHLVAGALAQDTGHPTVIVTITAGIVTVERWDGTTFGTIAPPPAPIYAADLRGLIAGLMFMGGTRGRVFVVHEDDPFALPAAFDAGVVFDRIVYLTDGLPKAMNPALHALLSPTNYSGSVPYFSSYLPSILTQLTDQAAPYDWLFASVAQPSPFGVERMYYRPADPAAMTRASLFRDACNVSFDLGQIATAWTAWLGGTGATPFIATVAGDDMRRAQRWGRAISNRRVGVAISGGGASAYRVTALLEKLEDNDVPIDVVTGLSGGAILGAYYSDGQRAGLASAAALGPLFQFGIGLVILSSWPLQFVVDAERGGSRVQDLDIRFAALTTELPPSGPPEAAVVTTGTIGEALRASGCLPPAFAPMRRHYRRYTDGGGAAIVPARMVRDCGADLAIACDVIPGAAESNPLDLIPVVGTLLHDWTPLGRLIDVWTWYSFMWSRASLRFAEEADVALQFQPQQIPFLECFLWVSASWIAAAAQLDPNLASAVNDAATRWQNLNYH